MTAQDTFETLIECLDTATESIDEFSSSDDGDERYSKVREALIKVYDLVHIINEDM